MSQFKQEYLCYPSSDFIGFLHRHPNMELKVNLPAGHVIVDEKDWKIVRQNNGYDKQTERKPNAKCYSISCPAIWFNKCTSSKYSQCSVLESE